MNAEQAQSLVTWERVSLDGEDPVKYRLWCRDCNLAIVMRTPWRMVERFARDEEDVPRRTQLGSDQAYAACIAIDVLAQGPERRARRREVERWERQLEEQARRALAPQCPHAGGAA